MDTPKTIAFIALLIGALSGQPEVAGIDVTFGDVCIGCYVEHNDTK